MASPGIAVPEARNRYGYIQDSIGGKLPLVAARAVVIGEQDRGRAHRRENRLGTHFPVLGLSAARTGQASILWRRLLEQLSQAGGSASMQGGTKPHLDRFQIQAAALAPLSKNDGQQVVYFLGDLLMNRSSRFFFGWSIPVVPPPAAGAGRSSH
jgi:hypothetical protein